jgi:hypothetical protein
MASSTAPIVTGSIQASPCPHIGLLRGIVSRGKVT